LTASTVNGSGTTPRTGAQALALLAVPLNSVIIRALHSGPKRRAELRRESGSPAQDALRSHLKALERIGVIVKHRRNPFRGSLEYELAEAGRELRFVAGALERWLAGAPEEPLQLGGEPAQAVVDALAHAWSSTTLRALAERPPSPTEPDAATDWLRLGVGPIAAASRWERRNLPAQTATIGRVDAETGLMLAMPLVQLPPAASGSCRLVVELSSEGDNGDDTGLAAVTVAADSGRVVSWKACNDGADAWAIGAPNAWFRAAIEADPAHLELGGNRRLARALLEGLYGALFGRRAGRMSYRY
jgi:DNA-binding HxlR family transcriptional regulator